jgi:hypothetical protein
MSKLSISEIQEAMARAKVEPKQQEEVINHLQEVIKEIQEEKHQNPTPKLKNKFGVIILDELGEIKVDNIAALIYQIQEDADYNSVPDRISAAIKQFNLTKKGQKHPVKSISEAFGVVAPKLWKAEGILRKTKEIVPVMKTLNKV